ncbi:unnamed protein product [Porites evermanni]|uniref:Uncharacterized protein n=1 Tax=Porites evermanni TaxID=104178 RepID=A0ABN8QW69_9CNID|nr:unnamed protein product [Porites evermanni]
MGEKLRTSANEDRGKFEEIKGEITAIREKLDALTSAGQESNDQGTCKSKVQLGASSDPAGARSEALDSSKRVLHDQGVDQRFIASAMSVVTVVEVFVLFGVGWCCFGFGNGVRCTQFLLLMVLCPLWIFARISNHTEVGMTILLNPPGLLKELKKDGDNSRDKLEDREKFEKVKGEITAIREKLDALTSAGQESSDKGTGKICR